jgi:hypothetical protein
MIRNTKGSPLPCCVSMDRYSGEVLLESNGWEINAPLADGLSLFWYEKSRSGTNGDVFFRAVFTRFACNAFFLMFIY